MRLETERLVLRVPEESDVDAWVDMYTQPAVERWLSPRSREQVAEYIRAIRERHAADGFGILAAVRKDDGRAIGRGVIALIDPENERSIRVAERLGLAHDGDVLQKGSKTMRLYALDARGVRLNA